MLEGGNVPQSLRRWLPNQNQIKQLWKSQGHKPQEGRQSRESQAYPIGENTLKKTISVACVWVGNFKRGSKAKAKLRQCGDNPEGEKPKRATCCFQSNPLFTVADFYVGKSLEGGVFRLFRIFKVLMWSGLRICFSFGYDRGINWNNLTSRRYVYWKQYTAT